MDAYNCAGSSDWSFYILWNKTPTHVNLWTSTIAEGNNPHQVRACGAFYYNLPSSHISTNADIGFQRPALINTSDHYNRNYNGVCNAEEIGGILCIRGTLFKQLNWDSVKMVDKNEKRLGVPS